MDGATTARPALPPRTLRMLEAPVLPTLLRLAAPNLAEAAARIGFIAADAVFVGWLGADALAGVSLVFPIFLLMQMVSASGFGTGVAAGVARALGAGDREGADRLAAHALWLALGAGALSSAAVLAGGSALWRALGAEGAALEAASTYAAVTFGGIVLVWLMNLLANVARGTGAMPVAAGAIVLGEAVHLTLSPCLVLGLGPFPAMGVAGAALAILGAYGTGAAMLLAYLLSPRSAARIRRGALALRWAALRVILSVGGLTAVTVLLTQATSLAATALVAGFGAAALAGFGAAQRLELLQIPLTFALGSAVIAMVAANLGAGRMARARQVARAGMAIAGVIGLGFGAVALLLPASWMGLFVAGEAAEAGALYLRCLGAMLPVFGVALGAAFALLGMGEAGRPAVAGLVRFLAVAIGGWAALGFGMLGLFVAIALAALAFSILLLAWARRLL